MFMEVLHLIAAHFNILKLFEAPKKADVSCTDLNCTG